MTRSESWARAGGWAAPSPKRRRGEASLAGGADLGDDPRLAGERRAGRFHRARRAPGPSRRRGRGGHADRDRHDRPHRRTIIAAIDAAAAKIAVLQTANTSLGVNLLRALVEEAARRLGPDWDIEILDMHHRHKLDAPSGTALLLGASANAGRGAASDIDELNRFDRMREGPHEREEGGIYYASLRGGSVAGDHLVVFAGDGERIELGHRAESRAIFAKGAVKAALWLAGKPAGRYTMADVLGL